MAELAASEELPPSRGRGRRSTGASFRCKPACAAKPGPRGTGAARTRRSSGSSRRGRALVIETNRWKTVRKQRFRPFIEGRVLALGRAQHRTACAATTGLWSRPASQTTTASPRPYRKGPSLSFSRSEERPSTINGTRAFSGAIQEAPSEVQPGWRKGRFPRLPSKRQKFASNTRTWNLYRQSYYRMLLQSFAAD